MSRFKEVKEGYFDYFIWKFYLKEKEKKGDV